MKGVLTFLVAVALGAALFWAFQGFSGRRPRDARSGAEEPGASPAASDELRGASSAAPASAPVLAKRPLFFQGDARTADPAAAMGQPEPAREPAPAAHPSPVPAPDPDAATARPARAPAVDGAAAKPAPAPALEGERGLAKAAFDTGDRKRGVRLLEDLYAASRDRPDVDLTPEVDRLLEVEARVERRREYLQYLARLDRTGRVFDDELARAARRVAVAEDGPEQALAAWDELSLAYEVASDRAQRRKALAQIEPFTQRMVFSGRYTPLLKSYTIQPGDNLSAVAAKLETTADSLRRLNGLKSDVIQPRQRLRALTGKVKLFVDKSEFTLWATIDGRVLFEFPVGLGRDNATPVGAFRIQVRQKNPAWWRAGEAPIPPGDPRNILGTRWLGFQETQELAGFGIHGTDDPSSLGKESSAGCIRLRNEDIELLFDFVPYKTEVVIQR